MAFALVLGWLLLAPRPAYVTRSDELRVGEPLALELRAEDPVLEGRGRARLLHLDPGPHARLHLFATSQGIDPFLRIETEDGVLLAEDDDSGGGQDAFVALDGIFARRLFVTVATRSPEELGSVAVEARVPGMLSQEAAQRFESLLEMKERARRGLASSPPELDARDLLRRTIAGLLELDRSTPCQEVSNALSEAATSCLRVDDGDFARRALEACLQWAERVLPPSHAAIQSSRHRLGKALYKCGDLPRAREVEEQALAILLRTLPEDHTDVLEVRSSLAVTCWKLGDLAAAQELHQQVIECLSRTRSSDDFGLVSEQNNLCLTLLDLGQGALALEIQRHVVEVYSHQMPPEDPRFQRAQLNLASAMRRAGDVRESIELTGRILELRTRTRLPDDYELQTTRINLAATLKDVGECARARELEEQALEVWSKRLPPSHPDLHRLRKNLAWTHMCLGERQAAARRLQEFADGGLLALREASQAFSTREAEACAQEFDLQISFALSFTSGGWGPTSEELDERMFQLVAAARGVGLTAARIAALARSEPSFESLRDRLRLASETVVQRATDEGSSASLADAIRERDALQREMVQGLSSRREGAGLLRDPTSAGLAGRLAPSEALVVYRAYDRRVPDPVRKLGLLRSEHLVAFVVRPGAPLKRIELGPVTLVEKAVVAWREELGIGSSADPARGVAAEPAATEEDRSHEEGRRLALRVLTPLFAALGDAERLIVVLDGILHLVPFDALPCRDGLAGERFEIEVRSTITELFDEDDEPHAEGLFLVLGGIDYDSEPSAVPEGVPTAAAGADCSSVVYAPAWSVRGWAGEQGFGFLPGADLEARALEDLHRRAIGEGVRRLSGQAASKETVARLASGVRFLHLATHGYFSSSVGPADSEGDESDGAEAIFVSHASKVRELSPLALCGLALAGANLRPEARGSLPGVLTAEEISSYDLTRCELAVLSACDTSLGELRAGQGVASLQRALHMAGARSVITSLWKVPDEATKELMVDFYRRVWLEKKPKAQALWEAKMRLRDAKDASGEPVYSTRDWAAWVLTGAQ